MKTTEELKALKEEAEHLSKKLAELSKEEIAQVTGGRREDYVTKMVCSCGFYTYWYGYFVGDIFDCPKCGNHTLKGVKKD